MNLTTGSPDKHRRLRLVFLGILLTAALILAACDGFDGSGLSGSAGGTCTNLPGAIFTTNPSGARVNQNIYSSKSEVYLQGGPDQQGAHLPDGTYYYRVTDPSGKTILYQDSYRVVNVANNVFPGIPLAPFDDTPNNGDEYKVWVSTSPNFENRCTKTDNFKVREPVSVQVCRPTGNPYPYAIVTIEYTKPPGNLQSFLQDGDIYPVPADGCPQEVTISLCHATGNPFPYEVISVTYPSGGTHGHEGHGNDVIPYDPNVGCPQPRVYEDQLCRPSTGATAPYPYQIVSFQYKETENPLSYVKAGDIYPVPADGCPAPGELEAKVCRPTGNPFPYTIASIIYLETENLADKLQPGDIQPVPANGCPAEIEVCRPKTGGEYDIVTIAYGDGEGYQSKLQPGDIAPVPAEGCPEPNQKPVTVCRPTGNPFPYAVITFNIPATENAKDNLQPGDIFPVPANGCPRELEIQVCRPTGENEFDIVTINYSDAEGYQSKLQPGDIAPVPAEGCPEPPPDIEIEPQPLVCIDYLVFHTFRDNNLEIYRLDGVEGAGGTLTNLSQSNGVDSRPSRSPNDALIVWSSNRTGNVELWYGDTEGKSQAQLTFTDANNVNPMFGPDNETVIFQSDRNGNWDVFMINIRTGEERQLTTHPRDDIRPFWSPDFEWVTFESNRAGSWDIMLFNTTTGEVFQLTRDLTNESFPAWSPNGKQIAFLSNQSGNYHLYVIDTNGENLKQITDGDSNTSNHAWSPEGFRLAYQDLRDDNLDIYTYDLRTDTEYRLTDYEGLDSSPTWDCGGTNIAFTSDRDGNPNIFSVFWQGGPQGNLTNSLSTDKWSHWSPSNEVGSEGY